MAKSEFIGLGVMGAPMAGHLIGGGTSSASSRSGRAGARPRRGMQICTTREVAQRKRLRHHHGAGHAGRRARSIRRGRRRGGPHAGKIVIDMSSISPVATKQFAKRIGDSAATISTRRCRAARSAPRSDALHHVRRLARRFESVRPLFEAMGKNITLVGENGAGQTCKVANQIVVALTIEAVAEALVFASRAGADPRRCARR